MDTDTWGGYRLLGEVYQHRSVKHSEEYVSEEGAHCNTAESEWSIFKPWWRRFRGIAKRYLHLYLSHHSFRRTYRDRSRRDRSRIERTQAMIGFLIIGILLGEQDLPKKNGRDPLVAGLLKVCASFYLRAVYFCHQKIRTLNLEDPVR